MNMLAKQNILEVEMFALTVLKQVRHQKHQGTSFLKKNVRNSSRVKLIEATELATIIFCQAE